MASFWGWHPLPLLRDQRAPALSKRNSSGSQPTTADVPSLRDCFVPDLADFSSRGTASAAVWVSPSNNSFNLSRRSPLVIPTEAKGSAVAAESPPPSPSQSRLFRKVPAPPLSSRTEAKGSAVAAE